MSDGTCSIQACAVGYFDINGTWTDGCECKTTGTSNSCTSPTSIGSGTLALGGTAGYTGNLVPAGEEAFLTITFSGNTSLSYHPHITMTQGFNEFAFDIYSTCGNALSCGNEGGSSNGLTNWEVAYTAGDPNSHPPPPNQALSNYIPIPAVGNGGTVIIHVYRRSGQPVSCNNYVLAISN
jgi:hypothetical protein